MTTHTNLIDVAVDNEIFFSLLNNPPRVSPIPWPTSYGGEYRPGDIPLVYYQKYIPSNAAYNMKDFKPEILEYHIFIFANGGMLVDRFKHDGYTSYTDFTSRNPINLQQHQNNENERIQYTNKLIAHRKDINKITVPVACLSCVYTQCADYLKKLRVDIDAAISENENTVKFTTPDGVKYDRSLWCTCTANVVGPLITKCDLCYQKLIHDIRFAPICTCDKSIDIPVMIAVYDRLDDLFREYITSRMTNYMYVSNGNRDNSMCGNCRTNVQMHNGNYKYKYCKCTYDMTYMIHTYRTAGFLNVKYMPALAYRMAQTRALIMAQSEQMYKEQLNYVIRQGTRRIEQLTAAHRKQIRHIKRGAVQSSPLAESEAVVVRHDDDEESDTDDSESDTDDSESDAPQWQSEY
jgi:hypothetical protein